MTLRKSRKRGAVGAAAKAVTLFQMAKPVGGAIKSFRRARAGKGLKKSGSGRRPGVWLIGLLGIGGAAAAAAAKKRAGAQDDLGYGPPNESHPSHETLAPAKAAAGQATNGEGGEPASGDSEPADDPPVTGSEAAKDHDPEGDADYSIAAAAADAETGAPGGPPGDDAGTDAPGRE